MCVEVDYEFYGQKVEQPDRIIDNPNQLFFDFYVNKKNETRK